MTPENPKMLDELEVSFSGKVRPKTYFEESTPLRNRRVAQKTAQKDLENARTLKRKQHEARLLKSPTSHAGDSDSDGREISEKRGRLSSPEKSVESESDQEDSGIPLPK